MRRAPRAALQIGAVVAIVVLAFAALHGLLHEVRWRDVRHAFHAISAWQIAGALAMTAASYAMLTLYDVLALRIIGRPLPYRTAALASFTSYTLSHNLGFALLTGGSARYRVYHAAGLDTPDIVKVVATASMTFWSGVVVMAGTALALHPGALVLGGVTVPVVAQHLAGTAILGATFCGLALLRGRPREARLGRWHFRLPGMAQALGMIATSAIDLALASAALLILVPGAGLHVFPAFFLGYALAIIAALVTHVPGGVGVFEAVMLAVLPGADPSHILAALILYRLIYYVLPLLVAGALLAVHERRHLRKPLAALRTAGLAMHGLAPTFLAALVFVGGVVLLVSGSLPAIPARLKVLHAFVPLPFVEASHIAASLAGTALLLIAPALYRRLDAAFHLCRTLLLAGALFSLVKGVDYEEAAILLVIAGLLQLSRTAFYRKTALTSALSPRALVSVAVAVALAAWIGFFAFKHVPYQDDLWWEFAWKGDASRFLRASFAAAVALTCVAVTQWFGYAQPKREPHTPDAELPRTALAHANRTDAMLAYAGDKRFLRSASGETLLMYQVQGQSWIVMGDPVGPRAEWGDLLWQMRELADAAQGRLLLYQISTEALPIAIDLGLQLVKYGEEARVALPGFTMDGPEKRSLRHSERRAAREGASFEIVPAAEVGQIMPILRAVSDAWLRDKGNSEKAFSVGRFDPAYIGRFDCAVVRRGGDIVAFANIWATDNREELSVDLMRHLADMPYGTMDFLFVQLMQWGRDQGYRWFNLGMAPLSGIESRRLAPIWARIGALLYRHGDAFYGFEGLRAYKDKFSPVWMPRYIAAPPGLGLARGMIDLQTLVGGGARSAARRGRLKLAA
ncbi:bifunctional lysylphosphatidylglycerol flippase/synthetase MprF [Sphingomonas sp. HITSZ_GF]|uniref:bifunctional lysylphosphatidylglycerol flippase/synthetase MprF n=1 Tax=Sphingomonas sp. HITSZ_GF TaxID=3037247 RepID=UPI00240E70C5|nr:bifunctional lysylphosphatidylglycerol flippase/synthetase MprF [Sphingomonas sp. HITSZ_GF]MDG2534114.1 bifunctional lysylphosphatidylglycerol flippase/synthetase MprF [Sphingomonas sp. HITSZ_GF]